MSLLAFYGASPALFLGDSSKYKSNHIINYLGTLFLTYGSQNP